MSLADDLENLNRVVVGVDPSGGHEEENDEQGIIIAGLGYDNHGYVLGDKSCRLTPDGWGRTVVNAYELWRADFVLGEDNYGGEMVEHTVQTAAQALGVVVKFKRIRASRGKQLRAEPVAALYEQCVAKGSTVTTAMGDRPIEAVRPGDQVWTRSGWRRVTWAGSKGIRATVIVSTECGQRVVVTPDHLVYVSGRGYTRADELSHGTDKLLACTTVPIVGPALPNGGGGVDPVLQQLDGPQHVSQSARSLSSGRSGTSSKQTATTERAGIRAANYYIEPSGQQVMGQYRMGGTSTILMGTQAITSWTTSKPSAPRTISLANTVSMARTQKRSVNALSVRNWPGGHSDSRGITCAKNVESHTRQRRPEFDSVPPPAIRTTGTVRHVTPGPNIEVFDLQVEGEPEFFANGVLVHNCRVHHLGVFPELEQQMTEWDPYDKNAPSPDRVDALCFAITELMVDPVPITTAQPYKRLYQGR